MVQPQGQPLAERSTCSSPIDEASYDPGSGAMGDHPIAWCHAIGRGRAWYTALGHRSETYADASFARHLLGGILWAAGRS